jgi:hypothetical protein
MNACRVARRVASMKLLHNACSYAGNAKRLETKVFHYPLQSFSPSWGGGRRLVNVGKRRAIVGAASGVGVSAGVGHLQRCGGGRRLACRWQRPATPSITTTLVTKENDGAAE